MLITFLLKKHSAINFVFVKSKINSNMEYIELNLSSLLKVKVFK